MKVHEYQSKQILKKYNAPLLQGIPCTTAEEVEKAAEKFGRSVVKSQIYAGGRGKGTVYNEPELKTVSLDGGVKLASSPQEAREYAECMLGKYLQTVQTGNEGKQVNTIYIEDCCNIESEYYFSILLDRSVAAPMVMVSTEGGMDIEEVAEESPEKIFKLHFNPLTGLADHQARLLAYQLGLKGGQIRNFIKTAKILVKAYLDTDSDLLEVNPLVLTTEDDFMVLDSKMTFDDNALYRHPEIAKLRDKSEEDPAEVEAIDNNLAFVKLEGNIGCMVNGAGLAMATVDAVSIFGKEFNAAPANFLDVGGGANAEKVKLAFRIILNDPSVDAILVNIFGGIMKCDVIAEGVLQAVREMELHIPLIVRLAGTNVEEGKKMIAESGLKVIAAEDLPDGCLKAAKAAAEYRKGAK
ncbi:MAG: ADP-forming succinate--CoA ligase subunit beta [Planctomycetes bacterium]|nr:ADP-forming succinate--CoA ligase subunit beta [Planctomycetota bacterium]